MHNIYLYLVSTCRYILNILIIRALNNIYQFYVKYTKFINMIEYIAMKMSTNLVCDRLMIVVILL